MSDVSQNDIYDNAENDNEVDSVLIVDVSDNSVSENNFDTTIYLESISENGISIDYTQQLQLINDSLFGMTNLLIIIVSLIIFRWAHGIVQNIIRRIFYE